MDVDEKYKKEVKEAIFDWAYTNPDNAKDLMDELQSEGGEGYVNAWSFSDTTLAYYGGDCITGYNDGAYYTETKKAIEAVVERGALIDLQFLDWVGEHDQRHLEDIFRDGGFDLVDVSYRQYVLERHFTATEILDIIQEAIKTADPQYKKLEIK